MFWWRALSAKIRRRESPFYDRLYSVAKKIHGISFPVNKTIHGSLYGEWVLRTNLWHELWRVVYYEPMFKSQCVEVGPGFRMEYAGNGCTKIVGDLQIYIGKNVTIFDKTRFVGLKVFDKPELYIGDNSYIASSVDFRVAKKITVGSYTMLGCSFIADNIGHPFDDPIERMKSSGGGPRPESVRPVVIGDLCQLTLETVVYPGTVVGDGVVAKLGTHLSRNIPPFCLISGNPWRIDRKLPIPEELKEHFGEDRYRQWKEQQDAVTIDS